MLELQAFVMLLDVTPWLWQGFIEAPGLFDGAEAGSKGRDVARSERWHQSWSADRRRWRRLVSGIQCVSRQ